MGLKEMALALAEDSSASVCGVRRLQSWLPADMLSEFNELLADRTIPATAISKALKSEGYDLSANVVQKHRRGYCRCH